MILEVLQRILCQNMNFFVHYPRPWSCSERKREYTKGLNSLHNLAVARWIYAAIYLPIHNQLCYGSLIQYLHIISGPSGDRERERGEGIINVLNQRFKSKHDIPITLFDQQMEGPCKPVKWDNCNLAVLTNKPKCHLIASVETALIMALHFN